MVVNVQTEEQMKSLAQGVVDVAKHTRVMGESERDKGTKD